MAHRKLPSGRFFIIPAIIFLFAVTVAWRDTGVYQRTPAAGNDTIPSAEEKARRNAGIDQKGADVDMQLKALDKAMEHLDGQMKGKHWEEMQKNIQEAISKIDMEKISQQLEEAMKQIDMAKIKAQTQAALSRIDYEKIKQQVAEATKQLKDNVDSVQLKKEMAAALDEAKQSIEEAEKVDFKQLEAELKQAKEELKREKANIKKEIESVKKELAEEKINIASELASARKEIAAERAKLAAYKELVAEMEKEGLVKNAEDYTIEFRDNGLYVNGNKQPDKIYNRYKSKVKSDKLTINKQAGRLFIDK